MNGKSRLSAFVRCRAAAATALAAGMIALMSVGGIALTADHTHLVYQRNLLKSAVEAAGLAAARHMLTLDASLTKAQLKTALMPIARRYILANIPANRRQLATDTLTIVELEPNRSAGTVDVKATAELGGAIFTRWMLDNATKDALKTTKAEIGNERLEDGGALEVALAIDTTGSMTMNLGSTSKMAIVKQAALDLVDTVKAGGGTAAVGLVPWGIHVRFDQTTRTRWDDKGWAVYPTSRYYPKPYAGSGGGETQTLPAKPEAWEGCLTQRSMSGTNPPGVSAALPAASTFTMDFYSPFPLHTSLLNDRYFSPFVAYQCTTNRGQNHCYSDGDRRWPQYIQGYMQRSHPPQSYDCRSQQSTLRPLTTDTDSIRSAINGLAGRARRTYSTPGIVWAHRLLDPGWRTIWGDATHPLDARDGVQKAIVLFTDGGDNYFGGRPFERARTNEHRRKACTAAKDAGIKIYVIAAIRRSAIPRMEPELRLCSSHADDPDGTYIFVNNITAEALRGSFQQVARQLSRFRRRY